MTYNELFEKTQQPIIDLAMAICNVKDFEGLQKFYRVYDYNEIAKYHKKIMDLFDEFLKENKINFSACGSAKPHASPALDGAVIGIIRRDT